MLRQSLHRENLAAIETNNDWFIKMLPEARETSLFRSEFSFVLPEEIVRDEMVGSAYRRHIRGDGPTKLAANNIAFRFAARHDDMQLLCMVTQGDGCCLLHGASLGMWGLHLEVFTTT